MTRSASHSGDPAADPSPADAPDTAVGKRRTWDWHTGRIVSSALIVMLCLAALWLLSRELGKFQLQDFRTSMRSIPAWRWGAAIGFAIANYILLIGYDWLAVRATGRSLSLGRISLASFCGFVTSNNFGALLGGGSVRYRLYSSWGLTSIEILQIVLMMAITFWIGVFSLAGVVFVIAPPAIPAALPVELPFDSTRLLGVCLLASAAIYLIFTGLRKRPIRFRDTELRLPSLTITVQQIGVAAADFLLAAGCLYQLVSDSTQLSYFQFLGVMLMAVVATVLSHVPGGVGVFELVIIKMCGAEATPGLIASLFAYRLIYYLGPLLLATVLLAGNEIVSRRERVSRWWRVVSPWGAAIAPQLLAAGTFLGGAVLLISGTMPVARHRLQTLEEWLPLPVLELSHFATSLVGATMLILGFGLQRRLDSAWWLAVFLTTVGIIAAILRGFDLEEASLLVLILVALVASRSGFYRRGSLLHGRFTPGWVAAVTVVIVCAWWLGSFAHRHREFAPELFWRFEFDEDAPRFLRGAVGAIVVLGGFSLGKLLRPARAELAPPTTDEFDAVLQLVRQSPHTLPHLALLGDKHFLFNDDRSGYVMFGLRGRSWVALGDPVGDPAARSELVWAFRDLVDRYDGWPVFYQVPEESLPLYLEQGLTLLKFGEEARVPLPQFNLDGAARRDLRHAHHRGVRQQFHFEVIGPEQVTELLPVLREISDEWLQAKGTREKGFSLGFFREEYLQQLPCAVVRVAGQPIAFANLWCGAEKEELSVDLMRYRAGEAQGVMDYLFIELMLWGKDQGYRWFNLGMAPLSGIASRTLAPLWNRAAHLVFRHGDHFYNFEGLRKFKEKFGPEWSSRYLASPSGWALPVILADLARLIRQSRPAATRREEEAS